MSRNPKDRKCGKTFKEGNKQVRQETASKRATLEART